MKVRPAISKIKKEPVTHHLQPGMLVTNRLIPPPWHLLVLEVGNWVECLGPDGARSLHPLHELQPILEKEEAPEEGAQGAHQ
jgi:hypothetical protein